MFVLDSYAFLCLLDWKRQREFKVVKKYFESAEKGHLKLYISKISEGEIFYKLYKHLGAPVANSFRGDLRRKLFPVKVVSVSDKRVERASAIKARYPLSYADAFCAELAIDMDMPIITGASEFRDVREVKIQWI